MKLLRIGETVEQSIELILPIYVHHQYKLMSDNIEMTFEQLDNLKSFSNELKTVTTLTLDYIVRNLSEDKKTFELLTCIEPFNAVDIDTFNLQPKENSTALKFISKGKGFDAAYLNEKLAPMYTSKKSIPKITFKSLLDSLENGLIEVQRQVTASELFHEEMLV
ncbi:hypothetical protein [Vagococcus lutrae]|uniref:hypothetical protein n=1 Tax=Vagococcus lutrae TaxID=81947 RepID=UPI00200D854C|nr:hypothetical protein [Vagococcus lutrae]MDT2823211.1 hypothetical protein [Vagococcus lutrae]UQF19038.1 hypothetical protein M2905_01010 [Vagococcus lutrae]